MRDRRRHLGWLAVVAASAAVLLAACDGDLPSAPSAPSAPQGGSDDCEGGPEPGRASLWLECLNPSVGPSADCPNASVLLFVSNLGAEPIHLDVSCGLRGFGVAAVEADGTLVPEPPCFAPGCVAPFPPWLVLPPGATEEIEAWVRSHGPHVARLRVGLRCGPIDPDSLGDFALCEATEELESPVFDVRP